MNKLSKEEVRHVASLGRIYLNQEEEEKFAYQLYELFEEINKINDIDISGPKLIAPETNSCVLRDDNYMNSDHADEIIKNAPYNALNFIEVAGVFDE